MKTGLASFSYTLSKPGWSSLPGYYNNGLLHMFFTGEEKDRVPEHVSYPLAMPF